MTTEKTYNGWTNYETWNVALWIGNEEGSYQYWEKEQAEDAYETAVQATEGDRDQWTDDAIADLADRLKNEFTSEDACPLLGQTSVFSDLLTAALSEVNWHEIARNYIENLDREQIEKDNGATEEDESEGD